MLSNRRLGPWQAEQQNASVDRLPEEVLCNIFRKCLPIDNGNLSFSTSISASLTISHVCRAWRTIALSYGGLWSHMSITLEKQFDKRRLSVMKDVFDTYLSRSGHFPLNVTLRCLACRDRKFQSVAVHMIKTLVEQQHRWKDMTIHWYLLDELSYLSDIITLNNMPLLTSLDVVIDHHTLRVVVDISRCLRLGRIVVRGAEVVTVHKPIETLRFPSSLTFYYGSPYGLRSCLSFLRAVPNLKHLRASFNRNNRELDGSCPHLFHQLRDLKVQTGRAASLFMDNVSLPSLQALAYSGNGNITDDSALLRLIRRSVPPLTCLDVADVNETTLLPVLRLVPALMDLRVSRGHFTARFFRELVVPDIADRNAQPVEDVALSPALVSLHLSYLDTSGGTNACIVALINMAKSRRKILRTFDEIRLVSTWETTDITIDMEEVDLYNGVLEAYLMAHKVIISNRIVPPDPFPDPERTF